MSCVKILHERNFSCGKEKLQEPYNYNTSKYAIRVIIYGLNVVCFVYSYVTERYMKFSHILFPVSTRSEIRASAPSQSTYFGSSIDPCCLSNSTVPQSTLFLSHTRRESECSSIQSKASNGGDRGLREGQPELPGGRRVRRFRGPPTPPHHHRPPDALRHRLLHVRAHSHRPPPPPLH